MKWDAIKGISYSEELNSICIDGKGEKKTIWKSEKRKERSPRKKAINRIILYLPYDSKDKYAIAGIIGMLVFQQIQNIGMTIGLLPIMGITLPFISYGGSSLISYMLLVGIIFNVSNQSLRYTN